MEKVQVFEGTLFCCKTFLAENMFDPPFLSIKSLEVFRKNRDCSAPFPWARIQVARASGFGGSSKTELPGGRRIYTTQKKLRFISLTWFSLPAFVLHIRARIFFRGEGATVYYCKKMWPCWSSNAGWPDTGERDEEKKNQLVWVLLVFVFLPC